MSSSQDWLLLPDLVFNDLMIMVGLQSLESLHRCRQVCKTWNDKIMSNIWENQIRIKVLKVQIEKNWGPDRLPSDEDISHAQWLGKYMIRMKLTPLLFSLS